MRILHYTLGLPPIRTGGLVKYALDLAKEQSKMNDVYILYPGITDKKIKTQIVLKEEVEKIKIFEIINPKPLSILQGIKEPLDFIKPEKELEYFKNFIKQIKPEVVHIHTLMGLSKEFIEICKDNKIRTIFTTHDYFPICPKVNLINFERKNCENSKNFKECILCNFFAPKTQKLEQTNSILYIKIRKLTHKMNLTSFFKSVLKKIGKNKKNIEIQKNVNTSLEREYFKLKEYYREMIYLIDIIHYNSRITQKKYLKHFPDLKGKIIHITHADIKNKITTKKKNDQFINIGFLGNENPIKGIYYLIDEYISLAQSEKEKINLKIYGIEKNIICIKEKNIIFYGKYSTKNLNEIFKNLDYVVIPSFWYETFNLVALEAKSHGIPVIISETVGAKDIFEKNEKIEMKIEKNELKIIFEKILRNNYKKEIIKLDDSFLLPNHNLEIISLYKK